MKKMMKLLILLITSIAMVNGSVIAQNLISPDGSFETRRTIQKKKFRVLYLEVDIDKTVDEVWEEVAGNFMNIGEIVTGINYSRCLSGEVTEGLGAERYCNLDFQGKTVELKERIIDFNPEGDYREFTYDVYESKGYPAKSINSWVVRKGKDGKTYLGSLFAFRAKPALLTGIMEKKLSQSGLRTGILAYKHYLETGEKKVDPDKLDELYPEQ